MHQGTEIERPFPPYALPRLWRWIEVYRDRVADDSFPVGLDEFVDRWFKFEAAGQWSWGAMNDGELMGCITSLPQTAYVRDIHCIFSKTFWRTRLPLKTMAMACHAIFSTGIEKICTMAYADNLSLFGLVNELGGKKEGTHPRHSRRGGVLRDMVSLGCEKDKFYELWGEHFLGNKRPNQPPLEPVQHDVVDDGREQLDHEHGNDRNDRKHLRADAYAGATSGPSSAQ